MCHLFYFRVVDQNKVEVGKDREQKRERVREGKSTRKTDALSSS